MVWFDLPKGVDPTSSPSAPATDGRPPYAGAVEFQEVLRRRRMVRHFTAEPLPPDCAATLLRAANRAPSAGFSQGYAFLALDGADAIASFWTVIDALPEVRGGYPGVRPAPLLIVPLSCKEAYLDRYARPDKGWTDRDEARWPVPYWDIDTGFAAMLVLLAAVDQRLGALFFGIPPDGTTAFGAAFGVPERYTPIGVIAVGHPDLAAEATRPTGSARTIRRAPLGDVVHRDRW